MSINTKLLSGLIVLFYVSSLSAQTNPDNFYFGNDLSYVNMMEDCGADFKEGGISKDVYKIYADHGNNLVRLRLWVEPNWQKDIDQPDGVKSVYSNFEDVKEGIQRAKDAGMEVLLDFHYSDFWADPGRQVLPSRWYVASLSQSTLIDTVYKYTFNVLKKLNDEGLMPELVQVGNENNSGIMRHRQMNSSFEPEQLISDSWNRHAALFNAGIQAVRDVSDSSEVDTKIALHYAGVGSGLDWWYENAINNGITDFDIIGFSYYVAYHGSSISGVGSQVARLANQYPEKEIMILETGYPWTSLNFDNNPNIITEVTAGYTPLSPTVQQKYMVDLTKAVMNAGGHGVIFWESAWVTTSCSTAWNEGSSHDHVVFFEPGTNNFIPTSAGAWMEPYIYEDIQSIQMVFKVDMSGVDVSEGVYLAADFDGDDQIEYYEMYNEVLNRYTLTRYLSPEASGDFYFLNGEGLQFAETVPEECQSGTNSRSYTTNKDSANYDFYWGTCNRIEGEITPDPEIEVTFAVDMTGINTTNGVYVTGDFTEDAGGNWSIEPMEHNGGDIYTYKVNVQPDIEGGYYFLNGNSWNARETVPEECVGYYTADRGYFLGESDTTYAYVWSSCSSFELVQTSSETKKDIPKHVQLNQNYPNPFNPSTVISFELSEASFIDLSLHNMLGQKVRTLATGYRNTGKHQVILDAKNLPSGIYIYRLATGDLVLNRKLMLIK